MGVDVDEIKRLISERGVDAALELHRRLAGKVAATPEAELTRETPELLCTPGAGAVSRRLVDDPSLPVIEGKALRFRALAGIDAVPIALEVGSADEFVLATRARAPAFGAINLEDIRAPECFEIERRLREDLDVPVIHDDQRGTLAFPGLFRGAVANGS